MVILYPPTRRGFGEDVRQTVVIGNVGNDVTVSIGVGRSRIVAFCNRNASGGERPRSRIITNRDLRFQKNLELTVDEVMTKDNLITGSANTDLKKAEEIFTNPLVTPLPVHVFPEVLKSTSFPLVMVVD